MNEQIQSQDRTLPVLCHVLALAGFTGIPFANVLGPLLLWLFKREGNPVVDEHGKESLNFQISMTIYTIVAAATLFIFIGFVLLPVVLVVNLVLIILAALEASKGGFYRYPFTIRFLK
jgi:uncharacterized Tic20 family protein